MRLERAGINRLVPARVPASGATSFAAPVIGCPFALMGVFRPTMMRPGRLGLFPPGWSDCWCDTPSRRRPRPQNAPENTIARFRLLAYHGYMTTRQAPKRPGFMNPAPRLSAALTGGVVAG